MRSYLWENIKPVEENNRERLNKMGPAPQGGIYHKPGTEDFTNNRRHQSQTSINDQIFNINVSSLKQEKEKKKLGFIDLIKQNPRTWSETE